MENFDLNTFKSGLLNGLGFTFTCLNLGYDPCTLSAYLRANPAVYKECHDALITAFKALLANANKLLSERKMSQWQSQSKSLKEFVGTLTLWEQHCKTDQAEADPFQVTAAFHVYRNPAEVATACGLSLPKLIQLILANDALKAYLKSNNLFN